MPESLLVLDLSFGERLHYFIQANHMVCKFLNSARQRAQRNREFLFERRQPLVVLRHALFVLRLPCYGLCLLLQTASFPWLARYSTIAVPWQAA